MSKTSSPRIRFKIGLLGLLAFALLTIRFSPNWLTYWEGLRDAQAAASGPAQRTAVAKAVLNNYSARGFYVLQQARDLGYGIDDPKHMIIRWRLLVPALGHFLGLPDWLILGVAHVGCLALIVAFAAIGYRHTPDPGRPAIGAVSLALIAGAGAPFFTSMGLLGYYDSLLALALLGVAFARRREILWAACVLAPLIDERFVLGLPLALFVRWIRFDGPKTPLRSWLREQALVPVILAIVYALVRLSLGGSGGSQTVGQYLNQFVFSERLTWFERLLGAWQGLRFGWILVAIAVIGAAGGGPGGSKLVALLLAAAVALTALAGLYTALDLARSMVLIVPVVPLGYIAAVRAGWRGRTPVVALLAAAALLLPASHVVGKDLRPVDNFWSLPTEMLAAQNNLGWAFGRGEGLAKNDAEAVRWFRKAAEHGNAEGEFNLGVMYSSGQGVPQDSAEAVKWYRKAAEQGLVRAEYNLGIKYAEGDGVSRDGAEAAKWLGRAGDSGNASADYNLGVMYAGGVGVPQDGAEAAKWYRKAAAAGNPSAPNNLGVMYITGNGVDKDVVQACRWFMVGGAMGSESAKRNLEVIEDSMTPEQIAEAAKLAR